MKNDSGQSLRICFVCDELPPAPGGGIGSVVRTLGTRLRSLGHEVFVIGRYAQRHDWSVDGPIVKPMLPGQVDAAGGRLAGRRALRERVRRLHEEVVLDVVEWPNYQGPFLSNVPGTVDVVRLHTPLRQVPVKWFSPAAWYMHSMRRRTLREIPNWIGVSRWILDHCLDQTGARPRRQQVIYNPVDETLFHPDEAVVREPLILFASALTEIKGVFTLARALRGLLPGYPEWRAVLAGRDPDGQGAARVRELLGPELGKRVELPGQLSAAGVAALMRRAGVVAIPSDRETFGLAWAEAMMSGAPLIASTTAAGPETVPGETGLRVPPGEEAPLREALERLLADAGLRRRLGETGWQLARERYVAEAAVQATLSYYRECLGRAA